MLCTYVDLCVPSMCSSLWHQERALDLEEMQLQVVVSHHVGAVLGTEPKSSARVNGALNRSAISVPSQLFLVSAHFVQEFGVGYKEGVLGGGVVQLSQHCVVGNLLTKNEDVSTL